MGTYLTKLLTTDLGSSQGEVRISSASQECNFSMQWPFNHCLHARVMLRASSALLRSRASGPSSSAQLQVTESDVALFVPATRSDIFLLLRKSSAVTTTGDRDVEGRGVSGIKRILMDILTAQYSTVLYSTVPKYLLRLLRQPFAKLLISCLSISRGCHDLYIWKLTCVRMKEVGDRR